MVPNLAHYNQRGKHMCQRFTNWAKPKDWEHFEVRCHQDFFSLPTRFFWKLLQIPNQPFLLAPLSVPFWFRELLDIFQLQLSTSSLRIHGGAIFSAVSGRKSIPISAIEAPEHGACYRVHGFYLTTTFCSTLAQQAVSNWNCHWNWRISRLGDHKYLPFVTNPYE